MWQPGGAISHACWICCSSAEKGGFMIMVWMWLTCSLVTVRKSAAITLHLLSVILRSLGSSSQAITLAPALMQKSTILTDPADGHNTVVPYCLITSAHI